MSDPELPESVPQSITPATAVSPRSTATDDAVRRPAWLLIAALIPLCWLGMQAVHEAGHIVAGWATGGQVTRVVLHPLTISRTDVSPNPAPRIEIWAGPIVGTLLPLLIAVIALSRHWPSVYLWRFFAGFCSIANGVYLGMGGIDPVGDAADLRRLGTPAWSLLLFGAITIPLGFWLWNGQGPHFGLGKADSRTASPLTPSQRKRQTITVLLLLAVVLILELLLSPRE